MNPSKRTTRRKTAPKSHGVYLDLFALELARGGAYIASALQPESRVAAMHEVVADFMRKHGADDLGVFLEMLVARLEARRAFAAAHIVHDYLVACAATPVRIAD
ncbi:hypothetical protein [Pararobbsia silviterrae]|uniref:Uncharacterized protein n=1 Tax=Pararobbsia silviterrae TaxID=1792498 RepID=A0A494YCG3_9BURK|nr:hypothetical protein [Pararobbsia silviterrae]RKP57684.1 hypothetical protein D7S86_07020 [Pararobbsia silviterrae]